jgi:hypothetical protein
VVSLPAGKGVTLPACAGDRVTLESDLFWFRTRDDLLEEWGYGIGRWHLVRKSRAFMTAVSLDQQGVPLLGTDGRLLENPETCIALALLDEDRNEFLGPCDATALASPELSGAAAGAPLLGLSPG